ncbi:hypothetical protein L7F22_064926 [Adiantum nelumboides]|nr:hypothetical protein [Adiantum nelumboides]
MEAVACGRDHRYIHRQPFSAKPSFYAPSKSHHDDATSEDSVLHSSLGGFQNAEVESLPADGSDCKASSLVRIPCCSKPSDSPGKGFDTNGKCGANGYHSDGAGEILESFKLVNQTYPHTCMDGCSLAEENDGSLGGKHGNIEGNEGETIGFLDIKSVESVDGTFVAPLRMPERAEVFDFDVSMCYSPDEWSSRASTESPLSVSASPRPPAWPFPVFNRCKTAPVGASITWDGNELERNLLRSRTDKEKKQKPSESLHQTSSTAEKLSERKRKKLIENLVKIKNDGTVEVDVDSGSEISSTLFELHPADDLADNIEEETKDPIRSMPSYLEIAMLIVGTRGDVQPFVSIGKKLKEKGHRVRLATHENFRGFVTANGLEFYPLGGDPKILAGYMVKNKGFLPSGPSEISIQKKQLKAVMNSLLPACTRADGDSGAPFKVNAIIANPIAYGEEN